MWTLHGKYAIAGIANIEYSKNSGRPVRQLESQANLAAINDAGLNCRDIDGFVSFNLNDLVPSIAVATELGIPQTKDVPALRCFEYSA